MASDNTDSKRKYVYDYISRGQLGKVDGWALSDFWTYCESLLQEMNRRSVNPRADCHDLPLANQMMCFQFAAANWEKHLEEIRENNRFHEMERKYYDEYGYRPMGFHDVSSILYRGPGFRFKDLFVTTQGVYEKLVDAGINTTDKFLAATRNDFMAIRGIGKRKADELVEMQENTYKAIVFMKCHKEFWL